MRIIGYAAFLDIMGFSTIVSGERHLERIDSYLKILKDSLGSKDDRSQINYVVFSDSIVVTTADDDDASLQALLERCSSLFGGLLANEIPVRGAIGHGTYVRETMHSGTFVAGRAIIEAYQFEGRQDWVGIMLAPSVIQKISNLADRCRFRLPTSPDLLSELTDRLPWAAYMQYCDQIPFHGEPLEMTNYQGFAIVPSNGDRDFASLSESLSLSLASLARLKMLAPSPQTQLKYQRCINWLSSVQANWRSAASQRDLFAAVSDG